MSDLERPDPVVQLLNKLLEQLTAIRQQLAQVVERLDRLEPQRFLDQIDSYRGR